jgi:hypothetical protein
VAAAPHHDVAYGSEADLDPASGQAGPPTAVNGHELPVLLEEDWAQMIIV